MSQTLQLRVYTDANCPFCLWSRRLVEQRDPDRRITFHDVNDPAIRAETPYTTPQLLYEMHVLTPEGDWFQGFWGWLAIARELPRWRWLATLFARPPFKWLGTWAYKLLAANRYRVPEWLLRVIGAPRPCDAACDITAPRQTTKPS